MKSKTLCFEIFTFDEVGAVGVIGAEFVEGVAGPGESVPGDVTFPGAGVADTAAEGEPGGTGDSPGDAGEPLAAGAGGLAGC